MKHIVRLMVICLLLMVVGVFAQNSPFSLGFHYGYAMSSEADFNSPDLVVEGELEDHFGASMMYGFSLGYQLTNCLQLELEMGVHQDHKLEDSYDANWPEYQMDIHVDGFHEVSTMYSTINLNYVLPKDLVVKPFVGAGVGFAHNKIHEQVGVITFKNPPVGMPTKSTSILKDAVTTSLAWQVQVGIIKSVAENLDVCLQYEYQNLGDIKAGDETLDGFKTSGNTGTFVNSTIEIAFVYKF